MLRLLLVVVVVFYGAVCSAGMEKDNGFNTYNTGKGAFDPDFFEWMNSEQRCLYSCFHCFDAKVKLYCANMYARFFLSELTRNKFTLAVFAF